MECRAEAGHVMEIYCWEMSMSRDGAGVHKSAGRGVPAERFLIRT